MAASTRLLREIRACRCETTHAEPHNVHARRADNKPTSLYYKSHQIFILSERTCNAADESREARLSISPSIFRGSRSTEWAIYSVYSPRRHSDEMISKAVKASVYNLATRQRCAL